jgi:hypothetical protein
MTVVNFCFSDGSSKGRRRNREQPVLLFSVISVYSVAKLFLY